MEPDDVNTTLPQLRPYQQDMVNRVLLELHIGSQSARSVLGTLPAGGCKTVIIADLTRLHAVQGKRVVILAHHREIIFQIQAELGSVAESYTRFFKTYPAADLIGLTATPYRFDKGLDRVFDAELVCGPSLTELIEQGHVVKPIIVEGGISYTDLANVPVKGGEYVANFAAGKTQVLVGYDIISEGLSVPGVGAIVLVRPTQNFGTYIQQAGRGLHPGPGKEDCLVLDLVGNAAYHGPPTQNLRLTLNMDIREQTGLEIKARADEEHARLAMVERMENFRALAARKSAFRNLYRPLQEWFPWVREEALLAEWNTPNDWQNVHVDFPRKPGSIATVAAFLKEFKHENWVAIHSDPDSELYTVSWAPSMASLLDAPAFSRSISAYKYGQWWPVVEFSAKPDGSVLMHPSLPHTTLHRVYTDHRWGLRHLFKEGYWTSVRGNGRVGAIETLHQLVLMLSDDTVAQRVILWQKLMNIQTVRRRLQRGWIRSKFFNFMSMPLTW
ncbi:hypothetical protein WJX72_005186 [[Myrmecia] bisecta]|uniref:Helicase n=1 Tax=[Myrmecia] bisecta TaxID=41462 RepID=A0AAW1PGB5_9CHLO